MKGPRKCSIEYAGIVINFTEIDGVFPNLLSVIPASTSGEIAQFNPVEIEHFMKFGRQFLGKKKDVVPFIMHNGASTACVTIPGIADFAGAVMPYRLEGSNIPAWLRKEVAEHHIKETKAWMNKIENEVYEDLMKENVEKLQHLELALAKADAELCC